LEASFRRLSEFSADVAHELRTPIANLTLQTQVALGSTRDAGAYREILYSSLEEYERLARMINDMLYLAQADDGRLRPVAEPVELDEQVHTLFDFFDAWAEEQGVTLVQEGQATASGDAAMLRRALSNLLSNAIRHTGQGGQVRVRLFSDAKWAYVRVENPAPIVPAAQLERLFDRFYRDAPQRSNPASGSGLGLAIVKAIVTAHGGEVSATSGSFGMRVELALPAAPLPRAVRRQR
jgi:two-component system heavy metal sensor histidine kinase CusS